VFGVLPAPPKIFNDPPPPPPPEPPLPPVPISLPPNPPPAEDIVVNSEPEIEEATPEFPLVLVDDTAAPPSPTVTVITVPLFTV
jgi:hypothetical protein